MKRTEDEAEDNVLDGRPHSGVAKEEGHGQESTDDHGVLAAQVRNVGEDTCDEGPDDTGHVGEGVVAPADVVALLHVR